MRDKKVINYYLKRKHVRFKLRFRKPTGPFRKPTVLEGLDCQTLTNTSQTHTHKPMGLPIPTPYPNPAIVRVECDILHGPIVASDRHEKAK